MRGCIALGARSCDPAQHEAGGAAAEIARRGPSRTADVDDQARDARPGSAETALRRRYGEATFADAERHAAGRARAAAARSEDKPSARAGEKRSGAGEARARRVWKERVDGRAATLGARGRGRSSTQPRLAEAASTATSRMSAAQRLEELQFASRARARRRSTLTACPGQDLGRKADFGVRSRRASVSRRARRREGSARARRSSGRSGERGGATPRRYAGASRDARARRSGRGEQASRRCQGSTSRRLSASARRRRGRDAAGTALRAHPLQPPASAAAGRLGETWRTRQTRPRASSRPQVRAQAGDVAASSSAAPATCAAVRRWRRLARRDVVEVGPEQRAAAGAASDPRRR